jgi:hypothetical protein
VKKFTTQELVEHCAIGRSPEYEFGIRKESSKDLTQNSSSRTKAGF